MSKLLTKVVSQEEGLSTAEYAVGTVAVAGLGGVLVRLLTSDWALDLLKKVIEWAFSFLFN